MKSPEKDRVADPARRWTPERLADCRRRYEAGEALDSIGAAFGIKGGTVAVMASERQWSRANRTRRRPGRRGWCATADGVAVPSPIEETRFNERLARTIRDYWAARGVTVAVRLEEQGEGVLGLRSETVKGIPASASSLQRLRMAVI